MRVSTTLTVEYKAQLRTLERGDRSSIGRTGPNEPRRLKLATKKQKARAAGAGTNLPAKAKPKKKTSRGK